MKLYIAWTDEQPLGSMTEDDRKYLDEHWASAEMRSAVHYLFRKAMCVAGIPVKKHGRCILLFAHYKPVVLRFGLSGDKETKRQLSLLEGQSRRLMYVNGKKAFSQRWWGRMKTVLLSNDRVSYK